MEFGKEGYNLINTILFDVDGVLLSEERYFDASALTVWELLTSKNYLGLAPDNFKTNYPDEEIDSIRAKVFQNDQVLKLLKSRGLNANWDMIYLTFSHQLIHLLSQIKEDEHVKISKWLSNDINQKALLEMQDTFSTYNVEINFNLFIEEFRKTNATKRELFDYLNQLVQEKFGITTTVFSGKNVLWSVCEHTSQEWYVGDQNVLASTGKPSIQTGKKGFLQDEKTLREPKEIAQLFQSLKDVGVNIGIGTGRPELETIEPFKHLDWLRYFDLNQIVTADDVLKAEQEHPDLAPLSKPNPFTYLRALDSKNGSTLESIHKSLPLVDGETILVVGDSLADFLAAKQMGCRFAAVLTGLSGKDARTEFEEDNAEFILDSVLDVQELVQSINNEGTR